MVPAGQLPGVQVLVLLSRGPLRVLPAVRLQVGVGPMMKIKWVAETGIESERWHAYDEQDACLGQVDRIPDEGLGEWWLARARGATMRARTLADAQEMVRQSCEAAR